MKLDSSQVLAAPAATGSAWRLPMLAVLGAWLVILVVHHETALRMVSIWNSSGNYGHCFVVLPIALWMAWTRRDSIDWSQVRPFHPALLAIAACGFVWLLGELASVGSVQQFALVGMLQFAAVAILGLRLALALVYPIAFLLFLVPTGDFMTPWLIDRTADFTVAALKLTGVPVFREGNDLTIPSGRWSVVEACSGTRYLVASMMAGTAFAYLQFQSARKRLIFFGVSIVVPLVANWVRAYLIVLIGHLTSNEYATGADHLVYGAFLFGVIIFILFAIGNRYRDPEPAAIRISTVDVQAAGGVRPIVVAGALAAAAGGLWIPATAALESRLSADGIRLAPIAAPAGWTVVEGEPGLAWRPEFKGARDEVRQSFERDGVRVNLVVGYFARQGEGNEMITLSHAFAAGDDNWRAMKRRTHLARGDAAAPVRATTLQGATTRVAVRTWYWMDDRQVASDYVAKGLNALDVLLRGRDDAALVVVYTDRLDADNDSKALDAFVDAAAADVNRVIAGARSR